MENALRIFELTYFSWGLQIFKNFKESVLEKIYGEVFWRENTTKRQQFRNVIEMYDYDAKCNTILVLNEFTST